MEIFLRNLTWFLLKPEAILIYSCWFFSKTLRSEFVNFCRLCLEYNKVEPLYLDSLKMKFPLKWKLTEALPIEINSHLKIRVWGRPILGGILYGFTSCPIPITLYTLFHFYNLMVASGIASIFMVDYSSIFPTDDRPIIDFFTPLLANISWILSGINYISFR